MHKFNWKIIAGIAMILLSTAFYFIHYLIFRDAHHIFIYLIGDIAFVFIEVLMVTLIIHHLLNEWEKRSHLKKLNMVIEIFFSEFGKHLLVYLSNFDRNLPQIHGYITDKNDCCELDFKPAFKALKNYKADIEIDKVNLAILSKFLKEKRTFLVNMLQNPNLLEHETFTRTLMSIFHIAEELAARDLDAMSEEDKQHTKVDIERAYNNLINQWLHYMQYTQEHYPYFFLFAMRTNPFDEKSAWLDRWYESIPA
ncbi:MAG: hypothetical protein JW860_00740 [Sedimentisphaerales bacterium]|nr:hypothetical protein [Sedimentisphaerales bacterium]